jgi:hypothetical protein
MIGHVVATLHDMTVIIFVIIRRLLRQSETLHEYLGALRLINLSITAFVMAARKEKEYSQTDCGFSHS